MKGLWEYSVRSCCYYLLFFEKPIYVNYISVNCLAAHLHWRFMADDNPHSHCTFTALSSLLVTHDFFHPRFIRVFYFLCLSPVWGITYFWIHDLSHICMIHIAMSYINPFDSCIFILLIHVWDISGHILYMLMHMNMSGSLFNHKLMFGLHHDYSSNLLVSAYP